MAYVDVLIYFLFCRKIFVLQVQRYRSLNEKQSCYRTDIYFLLCRKIFVLQVQRYLSMRSLGEARKAAVLGLTTTMVLILCVGWMGLVIALDCHC